MKEETKIDEGFLGQRMVVIPDKIKKQIRHNSLISRLYITDIGFYPQAKHHYRERQIGAEEYILIYCTEGKGWLKIEGEKCTVKPNHFFIIPKNTPHSYGSSQDHPWSIFWIHFSGILGTKIYDRYQKKSSTTSVSCTKIAYKKDRIEHLQNLITLLERGYTKDILEFVNVNLLSLLSSFIYKEFYRNYNEHYHEDSAIETSINYMQENLMETLSVEELATNVNYSESYFYRVFKKNTGYSPIQYFNHLKVQKACQYLSFTNLSVKEIAYKMGFKDPYYFSRMFKKLMKLSPMQYRDEYKSD